MLTFTAYLRDKSHDLRAHHQQVVDMGGALSCCTALGAQDRRSKVTPYALDAVRYGAELAAYHKQKAQRYEAHTNRGTIAECAKAGEKRLDKGTWGRGRVVECRGDLCELDYFSYNPCYQEVAKWHGWESK